MNSTTHRRFRMGAAVLAAVSLIGAQALTSAANATGTTTVTQWLPSSAPVIWSDHDCNTDNSAPSATPASPPTDALSLSGHQTYAPDTGPNATGASDVAWSYAPGSGQGGAAVMIPTTTTGLSIDVLGGTAQAPQSTRGRLIVFFNSTATTNNPTVNYVGVWDFATSSSWQTVNAGALTWYRWQAATVLSPAQWVPANVPFLQSQNVPQSLSAFFSGKSGAAAAAFEVGCNGTTSDAFSFAFDHLRVTDGSGNVTDYDAQTPPSTTTVSQGATSVAYGASTTITPTTQTTDGDTTTRNPNGATALQASVANGAWKTVQTSSTPGSPFTVAPGETTRYRVVYSASSLNPLPSTSNVVTVTVKPSLKLTASASKINVGKTDIFTARLAPGAGSVKVTFQQLSGTTWATLGSQYTNLSGVASLTKSRSTIGPWKVRALVAARTGFLATTSNTVTVGVYQPVSITAYRSVSTVYVGHYFRIYGTVTPHVANIPLQLQQYLSGRWVAVATGHSGYRGAYSFTKLARTIGTATFRVVAPASGYRKVGVSPIVKVSIVRAPVYTPPPPPPPPSGGGGSGIG